MSRKMPSDIDSLAIVFSLFDRDPSRLRRNFEVKILFRKIIFLL